MSDGRVDLTAEELKKLPFDFKDPFCLPPDQEDARPTFYATWFEQDVYTKDLDKTWKFDLSLENLDDEPVITSDDWERHYPGFKYLERVNYHLLAGYYDTKQVRWSPRQSCWIYKNNHPVEFPQEREPSSDKGEVSRLLERTTTTVTQTLARLTPERTPAVLPSASSSSAAWTSLTPSTPTRVPTVHL